ncbi:hypothetical protein EN873_16365 [bacterium M00.F.Ca.ET.230.01.1.1]|nr:hypothetical protein EN873_16365 [bacterium M00.F.Ca.ET.230.01.1.1]
MTSASPAGPNFARAVQRFTESPNRSKCFFLRNSGRKTVTHFSWNCSNGTNIWTLPDCRGATSRCRGNSGAR